MNVKKSWKDQIRGWVPKEPKLLTGNVNTHRKISPTPMERIVGGLGAAGVGLMLSGITFSFVPTYPHQIAVVMLMAGIPLLIAAVFVSMTYKKSERP